jgi:hypothetical protein
MLYERAYIHSLPIGGLSIETFLKKIFHGIDVILVGKVGGKAAYDGVRARLVSTL